MTVGAAADGAAGIGSAFDVAQAVADGVEGLGAAVEDRFGTVTLTVPVQRWLAAHDALVAAGFDVLDKLAAVDEPAAPEGPSVDVVAVLVRDPAPGPRPAGAVPAARVILRTRLVGDTPLPSLTGRHAGAAWHEREAAELMGVQLSGFREQTPDGPVTQPRPLLTAGWPEPPGVPPLRKAAALPARAARPWPGAREPVEPPDGPGDGHRRRTKGRRPLPPGVPADVPAEVPPS